MELFCLKQKKKTGTKDIQVHEGQSKKGKPFYRVSGACDECGTKKSVFISKAKYDEIKGSSQ